MLKLDDVDDVLGVATGDDVDDVLGDDVDAEDPRDMDAEDAMLAWRLARLADSDLAAEPDLGADLADADLDADRDADGNADADAAAELAAGAPEWVKSPIFRRLHRLLLQVPRDRQRELLQVLRALRLLAPDVAKHVPPSAYAMEQAARKYLEPELQLKGADMVSIDFSDVGGLPAGTVFRARDFAEVLQEGLDAMTAAGDPGVWEPQRTETGHPAESELWRWTSDHLTRRKPDAPQVFVRLFIDEYDR